MQIEKTNVSTLLAILIIVAKCHIHNRVLWVERSVKQKGLKMKMSIKELVEKTVENVAIVTDRDFPVGSKGNAVQLNESKTQAYELGQDSWHRDGHLVDFKSYFKDMDVSDNGYIRVHKLDLGSAYISVDLVIKAIK